MKQVLTLREHSGRLFRPDTRHFLPIASAICGWGIRHVGSSFPVTWLVPGCAATRAARSVDETLYKDDRLVDIEIGGPV